MQTLHFAILPYRSSDGTLNPDFINLVLTDGLGHHAEHQEVCKGAWRNNEYDCQTYWKRTIISRIHKKLENYDRWHAEFKISDADYNDWYRWYYFIDGEDAREFIEACEVSQHTTHFQSRIGVVKGWEYFKKLKKHEFNTSTAALLAYARGYIDGMNLNAPWDAEGDEALACLGLAQVK